MHANTVDFETMRASLLPLTAVQEKLATTEPLAEVTFKTGGQSLAVAFADDVEGKPWHKRPGGDPAPAWLRLPGGELYQFTAEAAQQLGSKVGMPDQYQAKLPAKILNADLNYWLREGMGEADLKLLTAGLGEDPDGNEVPLVQAVCRPSTAVFSNIKFLEVMVDGLRAKYGADTEILADYKFAHDLERTAIRLIVPGYQRAITGTSVADDIWSLGLDFHGSLVGLRPTTLAGYQFRWWCTNGATENLATSGTFGRRGSTEEAAMEWAKKAVDEILGGLEDTLDQTQGLVGQPVGGEVVPVLKGLFREFGINRPERVAILETMADTGGDLSVYDLLSAVTMAANAPELDDRHVTRLLDMGGHLVSHGSSGTCPTCHQLAPEGFEAAIAAEAAAEASGEEASSIAS